MDFEIARWDLFELDTRRRLLLASGKPVKLDAIAFDLLVYLVASRAAPVTRDDILANVWQGKTVDPSNVTVQLSGIRAALKKGGADQPLILTQPGPCYRFVGDVTTSLSRLPASPEVSPPPLPPDEPVAADPLPPSRRRIGIAAAGSVAALALLLLVGTMLYRARTPAPLEITRPSMGRLSMVVKPFRYQSPDQSQNYLADEITDDLTMDLAHIPATSVIDRESATAYKNDSPQEMRRDLNVAYEITGTVRPEDTDYRVIAELIDTATGIQLWSHEFEEQKDRLSKAELAIVQAIASNLHFQLDQLASTRSLYDRPDNPDALDLFFQARARLDLDDRQAGLTAAQGLLERSITKQPDFADAKAELGWLLLRKVQTIDDDETEDKDWIRATLVIDQALRLAPRNSTAIAAMARELLIRGKYREAASAARQALSIEPSGIEAHWVLANCSWMFGQLDAEAEHLDAISRLNPDGIENKHVLFLLGIVRLLQGYPSEAIELLLRATSGDTLPQPGAESMGREEYARAWLIAAYGMDGELDVARTRFREYQSVWPNRSVWRFRAYLPRAVAELSNAKRALQALHDAGMQAVGDGSVALASADMPCGPDIFSATPVVLPKGSVVGTADVLRSLSAPTKPLILDVGLGVGGVPTAEWFDPGGPAETTLAFAEGAAARGAAGKSTPIIVMGDGPFGCSAYNTAKDLILQGYETVSWYRGGEEAWANSGNAVKDFRPE